MNIINNSLKKAPTTKVEILKIFKNNDLEDICDATIATINDDNLSFSIGFNKPELINKDDLKSYWKGVILIPGRTLIIGRLDGVIASTIQLFKPNIKSQTSNFTVFVENHFVTPWARGYGLAKELLLFLEEEALNQDAEVIRINVRDNLINAIKLYENNGYTCFGQLERFEKINGQYITGRFYYKNL